MSKTHVSRKEMKEPDKFQVTATRAAGWLSSRRRYVIPAGVVALVLALVVAVTAAVQTRREERAGAAAADLLETMGGEISSVPLPGLPGPFYASEDERQRAIIAAADRVLAEHRGTGAARLAALAKGDALLRLGEWDEARAAYDGFLADAPRTDSLRFGAIEGIAMAEEAKGNLQEAVANYERLGREAPAFADRADLERARILASAGKVDEARELLASFPERHERSVLTPVAAERLAALGGR
jgi:tetratricopeptide (TPR) repeat protein